MTKTSTFLVAGVAAAAMCMVAASRSGCSAGRGTAGPAQTRAAGGPAAVTAQGAAGDSARQGPGTNRRAQAPAVRSLSPEQLVEALIRPAQAAVVASRPAPVAQPGLYGELVNPPRTDFGPCVKPPANANEWLSKPFAHVVSELSPAVLYRSQLRGITFFNKITEWGHGGPTHVALATGAGILVAGRGERLDGRGQTEPWILAWFSGAEGWLFDVPWLVVLERRAESISLEQEGLIIRFGGPAGNIVAMPFYGYYKVPPAGTKWSERLPGAQDFGIDTGRWEVALPQAVVTRARWWSEVLRRYPIRCKETFRVDRLNDVLTIRSEFEYIEINDDWGTGPRPFAPLSPTVALALTDEHNTFPMRFSAPVTDPFIMTPHGPYMGIEGRTSYDTEFDTLKYIHEEERAEGPPAGAPGLAKEAYKYLQAVATRHWPTSARMAVDHWEQNYVWAAMGDRWYPRALPYVSDPRIKANARESLRKYLAEYVLQDARFTAYKGAKAPGGNISLLEGPGIGSWGELGDAGKFSENLYTNLWSYANYTGDVETIKARWDLVKTLDVTPLESGWKGFGRNSIAEMGDEAAPPIDYARLAWMAGDIDTYYYQCYIATRELLHHFVKQNGAQYFRRMQPYHQYFQRPGPRDAIEAIPANVFLSNLYGGILGWQVDGPTYPADHGERQYQNRWVRFSSLAVGRFYRDHIRAEDLRAEFEDWQKRFEGKPAPGPECQWVRDDPHIMPSLVRLKSLTLDAPIEELEELAVYQRSRMPFDRWRLYPDSAVFASAIAIIRLSHPRHYDRLIPKSGPPGPWLLGLERSIESDWSILLQQVESWDQNKRPVWPVVGWVNWQTPGKPRDLPGRDLFGFGAVTPTPGRPPRTCGGWTQVNWNTYVTWYED
jgi:hypothetical protein